MRDNGHNEIEGETSDGETEEIQKTKQNQQEHTEGKKEKGEIQAENRNPAQKRKHNAINGIL